MARDVELIGWIAPRVSSEIIRSQPPFDAAVIAGTAQAHEEADFDRVLIGYFANAGRLPHRRPRRRRHRAARVSCSPTDPVSWPPPWPPCKLATLDQLGGRLAVHLIARSSDADQARDGGHRPRRPLPAHGQARRPAAPVVDRAGALRPPGRVLPGGRCPRRHPLRPAAPPAASTARRLARRNRRPRRPRRRVHAVGRAAGRDGGHDRHSSDRCRPPRPPARLQPRPARSWATPRPRPGTGPAASWPRSRPAAGVGGHRRRRTPAPAARWLRRPRARCTTAAGTPLPAASQGNSTALVGTPDTVAEALVDYYDLGATTLLIRGYDPLPDAERYGRELIPRVRELVARRRGAPASPSRPPSDARPPRGGGRPDAPPAPGRPPAAGGGATPSRPRLGSAWRQAVGEGAGRCWTT